MAPEHDRTAEQIIHLQNSIGRLANTIQAQGIGVSEKLDHASFRIKETLDNATGALSGVVQQASAASDRHANALVRATRWLVYATTALVIVTAIHALIAATPFIYAAPIKSSDITFTLYRGSLVGGGEMRIHVATFDAAERADYNQNNCEISQQLFAAQPGVTVKYWCEPGPHKK